MKIFALIFNEEKHKTISNQGQIISFYLIVNLNVRRVRYPSHQAKWRFLKSEGFLINMGFRVWVLLIPAGEWQFADMKKI